MCVEADQTGSEQSFDELESLVVGVEREVYRDGQFNSRQMSAALITRTDVFEAARHEFHALDLHDVHAAILERNGQMSLIRKGANGSEGKTDA